MHVNRCLELPFCNALHFCCNKNISVGSSFSLPHIVGHSLPLFQCALSSVWRVLIHCAAVGIRFLSIILTRCWKWFCSIHIYVPSDTHCSFHIKATQVKTRMVHLGMYFISFFLPDFLLYNIFLCSTSKSHTDWDLACGMATIHYLPVTKDAV